MSYSNAWMILKGVPVMLLRNEVRVIRWSRFVNYQAMRNLGELLRAGDAQAYIDAMNNGDIMSGINRANIEGFNLEFMQTPKSLDLTAFAEFGQESILTTPDGLLVDMEQVGKFILDLIPEAVTDGRRRIASRRQDPLRSIPRIIGGMLDDEATQGSTWTQELSDGSLVTVMQWNVVTQGTPDMEHLVQTPDATPTPLTFEVPTVLSWYNSLFFGEQSSDGWLVVKTPKGLVGVNIHVPVRVASIGTEPYYQVWHDESGADVPNPIPWTTPVDDPAKPYTFPSSVGYQVTVKPTSSGTTLFVNVYIDSLSE